MPGLANEQPLLMPLQASDDRLMFAALGRAKMTSSGDCRSWLPATPNTIVVPLDVPVSRLLSPPMAVPPGGLVEPGGPTQSCGSATSSMMGKASAGEASAASRVVVSSNRCMKWSLLLLCAFFLAASLIREEAKR